RRFFALRTRSADLVNVVGVDADAVLDGPRRALMSLGLIVVRQAFLERFHALGDIAHEVGNLALAAEQQKRDRGEQHPMPNAQATHGLHPIPRRAASTPPARPLFHPNLSARTSKNKLAFVEEATEAGPARRRRKQAHAARAG